MKQVVSFKQINNINKSLLGLVEISWLGSTGANVYKNRALLILFDYLTSTSAAPLKRDFVQIADPYCSSVDISLLEQTDCEIIASFEDVPTSKLYQIRERFDSSLFIVIPFYFIFRFFNKTVADHYKIETFDMERLRYMIDQKMRSFRLKLENSPHSFITDAIIGHQLYGPLDVNAQDDLSQRLQEVFLIVLLSIFEILVTNSKKDRRRTCKILA